MMPLPAVSAPDPNLDLGRPADQPSTGTNSTGETEE